jgi:hypothetical protein
VAIPDPCRTPPGISRTDDMLTLIDGPYDHELPQADLD